MTIVCEVPTWTFGPSSHRIRRPGSALQGPEPAPLEHGRFVLLEGSMELIVNAEGSWCFSWWQGLDIHTPLLVPCYFSSAGRLPLKAKFNLLESWEKPQEMPAVILIKHTLPRGKTQPLVSKEGTKSCPQTPPLSETARPDADVLVSNRSKPLGSSLCQWHPQPGL